MNSCKEIFAQIENLSSHVTEDTYYGKLQQGYTLLVSLHDMGFGKEDVYQTLFQYNNGLDDSLSRDFIADLLDYVTGWCSPSCRIWHD